MNKEDLFKKISEDLKSLSNSFELLCELESKMTKKNKTKKNDKKEISFEELRAFLADKSRLGFTSDIKALINSFGANRLSEVKESDYDELLKKAKELKDE